MSDRPEELAGSLLIVDDDIGAIQLLRGLLSTWRDVRFATNGTDALRLAREQIPDVVILDAEMPGLSGIETCRALKADARLADIPVIFVTAHSAEALEAEALDAGAADFLSKPVSRVQVNARVRAHLRLRRMSEARRHTTEHLEAALQAGSLGAWEWEVAVDRMNWHASMRRVRTSPAGGIRSLADHLADLEADEAESLRSAILRCAGGEGPISCDYHVRSADDLRQLRSQMTPVLADDGRLSRVVGVDHDITAWQRARTLLLGANRQLEQFAYFASHDLRAPARQMKSLAMLASQRLAEGRADTLGPLLEKIEASGDRVQELVQSLLDMARHRLAEPGEWRQAAMREVVESVLADLAELVAERRAEVAVGPMGEAYIPVNLISHVWRNLIANALRHQAAPEPRVWIGSIEIEGREDYYVEDAGSERTRLERLLARQSHGYITPETPAAGMGLEISGKVLRILGGQLWCEQGEHGGTRMRFSLGKPAPESPR